MEMDIGYEFRNKSLLNVALTHISLANDTGRESNQRLEFLGDSILSFIIADTVYNMYPNRDEGELTRMRAALVCEKTLAGLARRMDLGSGIKFGKAEAMSDGIHKESILADTFEAVLGAVYLDSDEKTARQWVLAQFGDAIGQIETATTKNFKSELQIYFQKRDKNNEVVKYRLKNRTGPDHSPSFTVEALYENRVIGVGSGKKLKTAEQNAAQNAFEELKRRNAKV